MKEFLQKIWNNLKLFLDTKKQEWLQRWRDMDDYQREAYVGKTFLKVIIAVGVIALVLWYEFGPPSVVINDIKVPLDHSLSLRGKDDDNNGVRDDIDQLISVIASKKHFDQPKVKSMQQFARAEQIQITVDIKSRESVRNAADKIGKGIDCLMDTLGQSKESDFIYHKINDSMLNTRNRIEASARFDHAMSGSVTGITEGNACE